MGLLQTIDNSLQLLTIVTKTSIFDVGSSPTSLLSSINTGTKKISINYIFNEYINQHFLYQYKLPFYKHGIYTKNCECSFWLWFQLLLIAFGFRLMKDIWNTYFFAISCGDTMLTKFCKNNRNTKVILVFLAKWLSQSVSKLLFLLR